MNEHDHKDGENSFSGTASGSEGFLCRPWPCASCRQGISPIRYLFGSRGADSELLSGVLEEVTKRQASALVSWVEGCSHTSWEPFTHRYLTQGSEHAVYLDGTNAKVSKITLPGTYGDFYYLVNGKVYQERNTPLEYLVRLHLWKKLFRGAPVSIGITREGRIITTQRFITGDPPTQEEVNHSLEESGLIPVKAPCFLWKKVYDDFEIWLGDTRDENFVKTASGIVPIDIRIWFA